MSKNQREALLDQLKSANEKIDPLQYQSDMITLGPFTKCRKGPTQLQRLRHPGILHVLSPLAESKDLLAFVTEPIVASLANILGRQDNLAQVKSAVRQWQDVREQAPY